MPIIVESDMRGIKKQEPFSLNPILSGCFYSPFLLKNLAGYLAEILLFHLKIRRITLVNTLFDTVNRSDNTNYRTMIGF